MTNIILAGKRFVLLFYSLVTLIQINSVSFFRVWSHHWTHNFNKIITLTSINTSMTFTSEFITRGVLSSSISKEQEYKFITGTGPWYNNINKQSMIALWMTFFATLLGAPVYFFKSRWARYFFFISFGVFNSFLSQSVYSVLKSSTLLISGRRLFFDLLYNGSLKFIMFEFFRAPIKKSSNIFKLYFFRAQQDVATSFIKNMILNLFRFKG